MTVHACVPYDPQSKGGSEATVRISKADLVPTDANLLPGYGSFADLAAACEEFMEEVNNRVHRETMRIPAHALAVEQRRMHPLPAEPFTMALGETRTVHTDQTVRVGNVRDSTPPTSRPVCSRCFSVSGFPIRGTRSAPGPWSRWVSTANRRLRRVPPVRSEVPVS
ncbi:MAG: hypothetical protein KGP12_12715 [Actinomycetales bacterium]|nr:hypothetical protein [Actinomycetales bacterium]